MKYSEEKTAECAEWVRRNGLMEHGGASLKDFCDAMGIDKGTYYNWLEHSTFSTALTNAQKDYEGGLARRMVMTLARAAEGYIAPPEVRVEKDGDGHVVKVVETTKPVSPNIGAAIFLLTNLDDGGWKNTGRGVAQDAPVEIQAEIQTLIEERVTLYTEILKERGKDVVLLSASIRNAAVKVVRYEMSCRVVFSEGYRSVMVEHSREGSERRSVNPMERVNQQLGRQAEDALRAIGLTIDAKEGVTSLDDSTSDFLAKHRIEEQ